MTPWLLAALSGVLLALSFPPLPFWPLAWIALVPLLAAVRRCPDMKSAANLAGLAGLVFYASSLHWLVKVFGPMAFAFWCLFSLWLALHAVILWKLKERGLADPAWIAMSGIIMTGVEYFRAEVWWLHCSWLSLGYSQTSATAVLQTASLVGLYGLSGLIASFNAAVCLALERRWKPAAAALALVVGLAAWGQRRAGSFPADGGRLVKTALVQDESYDLGALSRLSLAAPDADLLVWPEYAFTVSGREEPYRKLLAKKLEGLKAVRVLPGAIFPEDMKRGREQNFAWVLSPAGELLGRYDKAHPIPFVETILPANNIPKPVDTPLGRLGVEICYDLDFEDTTRALVRQGAQILIVPDLDPMEWGSWQHRQHSAMSAARAVESRLWIARSASSGESQFVDPVGRVRSSLPSGRSAELTGEPRLLEPGTVYSRGGWLLAPLCLAVAAALLFWLLKQGRRPAP
ncbi:MAG: hypothetical protein HY077_08585 [Elusimicrobia bacterium]|nr:hypothetical protein [Elusimicrobiota bacterium]